jgi:hypothetical protein
VNILHPKLWDHGIDGVVSLYHRRLDTIPPQGSDQYLANEELNCCVFNVTGPGT